VVLTGSGLLCSTNSLAATLAVDAQRPLQASIDAAAAGDELHLAPGRYIGSVHIDKPLTLIGPTGAATAIIDAGGHGTAITVVAPGVTLNGLHIEHWGADLTAMDAGIAVRREASGALIRHCDLKGPGFGIWLDGASDASVSHNRLRGDPSLRSQDRGNGIHLFNVGNAHVVGNDIRDVRDGIYIDTSHDSLLETNHLEDLRYGVHYMYAHDNTLRGNVTRHTRTGYALMQSKGLTVVGNRSLQDRNYGILMNNITDSQILDNTIVGVRQPRNERGEGDINGGDGKAIFIYNAQFNRIEGNRLEDSDIGIHLTAGSEDNRVVKNAFVANRRQVKYVATRAQEWSADGRGNYWSDYLGWDLEEDGIGDRAYEPNDAMDRLLWRHPSARVLMDSPAVLALRWVQRAFPVFRPQGVRDSAPLMQAPEPATKRTTS